GRAFDPDEIFLAVNVNVQFMQLSGAHHHAVDRESVEQFVRENYERVERIRDVVQAAELNAPYERRKQRAGAAARIFASLVEDVSKFREDVRGVAPERWKDAVREMSRAAA